MKPREAAYLALLSALRHESFISDRLAQWKDAEHPSEQDFAFAYEVASGSARMALAIDYIGEQLSARQKLSLKLKEKALLRTAIYQHQFMDKVPLYAIVNETIEIAKKHFHHSIASYFNALLRRLEKANLSLPQGNSLQQLSIRYSYPQEFITDLLKDYNKEETIEILEAGNTAPKIMLRIRPGVQINAEELKHLSMIASEASMCILEDRSFLSQIASSPKYYIQNATPATLISDLASHISPPRSILDLCASPGGKLLAAHDLFPNAVLFANDVSSKKLLRISENLSKYHVEANLSCGPGEEYKGSNLFDLIILDVPCSNSGVLNKRPEARWRLIEEALNDLQKVQFNLIERAVELLEDHGSIFYLTCSILKCENEEVIKEACRRYHLKATYSRTILPNKEGWDGGFGCLLTRIRVMST